MHFSSQIFHKFSSPGTYVDTHRRQYRFQHSFGGPLKVIPAVRIVCTPKPLARCHVCSELPRGEYFHNWRIAKTLCSICMFSAVQAATYRSRTTALKIRRLKDLNEFVVCQNALKDAFEILTAKYFVFSENTLLRIHARPSGYKS